jgi:hypothetical protein
MSRWRTGDNLKNISIPCAGEGRNYYIPGETLSGHPAGRNTLVKNSSKCTPFFWRLPTDAKMTLWKVVMVMIWWEVRCSNLVSTEWNFKTTHLPICVLLYHQASIILLHQLNLVLCVHETLIELLIACVLCLHQYSVVCGRNRTRNSTCARLGYLNLIEVSIKHVVSQYVA